LDAEYEKQLIPYPFGAAWLVRRKDGGPIRPIANGRRHRPVGSYFSVKCGRSMPWESRPELHGLWRADVRTDVLESWVQPFRLEFLHSGRRFIYTPDRKDQLATGKPDIVEVKDVLKVDKDPLYYFKLNLAGTIISSLGWSFRVEDRAEIEAEPAFSAIRIIQRYSRTAVSVPDIIALNHAFVGQEAIPLHTVQMLFGGGPRSLAAICALIVKRKLSVDLANGLVADAKVSLVPEKDRHDV
jgi:hypothetical protein